MVFKQEASTKKIKEFLELVENHKLELRHYKEPVLVWAVQDGTVYYSMWENDTLTRYGLENVDGWDFEEDRLFCPDWVDEEDDDDDFDDDDDDDGDLICDLKLDPAR
jgi:hypothetical protein